jgi:uncharacterized membrane protein
MFILSQPKKHIEFLRFANFMKVKGSKILHNVKIHWTNKFNPSKKVITMYMPLMAKMAKDNTSITSSKVNFDLLCDINLLISLSCLSPMLKIVHALIKFAQTRMYLHVDMLQPSRSSKVNYTFTMWIQE